MWNENGPLELLSGMPAVLTEQNLSEIQECIDNDKFLNSKTLKEDLCGGYAPFCKNCDKSVEYPCAVAYVRMKIKQGMQVEMQNISSEAPETPEQEESAPAPSKKIRIAVARRKF